MSVTTSLRAVTSALLLVSAPALGATGKVFPDPTAAIDALVAEARSGNVKGVVGVLGDQPEFSVDLPIAGLELLLRCAQSGGEMMRVGAGPP